MKHSRRCLSWSKRSKPFGKGQKKMDNKQKTNTACTTPSQINGATVRLVFAPDENMEVIAVVKDILKGAYIRSQHI
jgi:hypothetical protein